MTLQEIQQEARQRDLADIAKLMDYAEGRRVLYRILEEAKIFHITGNLDAMYLACREGQRNIGLAILNDIMEAAPKKYQVMMLEAKERRHLRQKREEAARTKKQESENERKY